MTEVKTPSKPKKEERIDSLLKKRAWTRVATLGHYFNIKEAIDKGIEKNKKLPLTDKEVEALLVSFTTDKDIDIYMEYRELNVKVISSYRWLHYLSSQVSLALSELTVYRLLFKYEDSSDVGEEKIKTQQHKLLIKIEDFLCYYAALREYMEFNNYKDKYIISAIKTFADKLEDEINRYEDKDTMALIKEAMASINRNQILNILTKEFKTHEK